MDAFNRTLLGAIAMGFLVSGVFFVRFWRQSQDRFFLLFALSFLLQGVDRAALGLLERPNEGNPAIYLLRLVAYLFILIAVLEKNAIRSKR